jgi:DNA-binding MarR family transcriptional regulator
MQHNHHHSTAAHREPWLYRISVVADVLSSHLRHAMTQTFGLTPIEWRLLIALDAKEMRSPSELARHLGLSDVVISRAITKLHRMARISRTPDESDARKFNIRINATGIGLRDAVSAWWITYETAIINNASVQAQEATLALLQQCVHRSRIDRLTSNTKPRTLRKGRS